MDDYCKEMNDIPACLNNSTEFSSHLDKEDNPLSLTSQANINEISSGSLKSPGDDPLLQEEYPLTYEIEDGTIMELQTSVEETKPRLAKLEKQSKVFLTTERSFEEKNTALSRLIIGWCGCDVKGQSNISVTVLTPHHIEYCKAEIRHLLENKRIVKVMCDPRNDFTSFLHYGIQMCGLFDVQSCDQAIRATAMTDSEVLASPKKFEDLCRHYEINIETDAFPQSVNKLCSLIKLYCHITRKQGEWFKASSRQEYLYNRKMTRVIRLTNVQRKTLQKCRKICTVSGLRTDNPGVVHHYQDEYNTPTCTGTKPRTKCASVKCETRHGEKYSTSTGSERNPYDMFDRHLRSTSQETQRPLNQRFLDVKDVMNKYHNTFKRFRSSSR